MRRFAIVLALLASPLGAQATGEVLTLDQAIALALENNRQLKNAALDVAKSQDQIDSNRTQRLPQLQLNVTPGYRVAPIELNYPAGSFGVYPPPVGPIPAQNTTLSTSPGYTTFIQLQLSQPLSQLYKIGLGLDQADIARDMSAQDLRNLRNATVVNVRQAYYAVLQSQSSLEALKEQATTSQERRRRWRACSPSRRRGRRRCRAICCRRARQRRRRSTTSRAPSAPSPRRRSSSTT